MMKTYERTARKATCPICSTEDAHRLWRVSSKQAAQHFVLQENHPERFADLARHIESLWNQDSCEIVQCDRCGFCYSDPHCAGDARFYALAYERVGYPSWKWEFQVTYDILKSSTRADAKILEIGAGDGAFVKRIADGLLPKENILCTEFSKYGREQIEKDGIRCFAKDVRELSWPEMEGWADSVCMFQVLEHMNGIESLFRHLHWLLAKDGNLFIAVPNPKRIEFNELNGALLDMPPNHIGRWNRSCFEEVGARYGFRVVDYKVERGSFPSVAKQFVYYRYLRNAQRSGGLSNRLRRVNARGFREVASLSGLMANAIGAIPALGRAGGELGNSQWVQLVRI